MLYCQNGGSSDIMMKTVNFTLVHLWNCRALLDICQLMSVSCPVFILFLNISLWLILLKTQILVIELCGGLVWSGTRASFAGDKI